MLKALYDYAVSHQLILPEGYVNKTVAAYIMFSSSAPDFVEVFMGNTSDIPCPDIGSLANGKEKCNIIAEKRSVVIPDEANAKSSFFRAALEELGQTDSDAKLCAEKLSDEAMLPKIREKLDAAKIKPANRISFMVDDRRLLDSPHLPDWWQRFRRQLLPPPKGELTPCLITGELTSPVATVPPVSGLQVVGGHARGDALICFDKPAFCSYGQKQAANAPVSEQTIGAVKTALDHLLADAPILSGMKFVHWYDKDISSAEDPILSSDIFGFTVDEDESEQDFSAETETTAKKSADRLINSVRSGEYSSALNTQYHILLLSGVGGRVMVRRYERGQYKNLQDALALWRQDLSLVSPNGKGPCPPMKLTGRLIRLLKYQKSDRNTLQRLSDELSGITPAVLTAILSGGKLPDAVAVRALAHIRSSLLSADNGDRSNSYTNLDRCACQWLKVWLIRHTERSDTHLKEAYNPDHPEAAYHCGAAMAVYTAIQNRAMPEVNATVAQRYYASCIQTPALVLGRLSMNSVHHLNKIEYKTVRDNFQARLEQTHSAIGAHIPTTLNLKQQSYFALGYYQMHALLKQNQNKNSAATTEEEEV